jgi:hypothetical protein
MGDILKALNMTDKSVSGKAFIRQFSKLQETGEVK